MSSNREQPADPQFPCPFCGYRATNASDHMDVGVWWISCTHCECEMSAGTKEGVIAAWNSRATPKAEPPRPLPFAVFDEFGVACDDRVSDHYFAQAQRPAEPAGWPEKLLPGPISGPGDPFVVGFNQAVDACRAALGPAPLVFPSEPKTQQETS